MKWEHSNELSHVGVKGMKWGIIRSAEQLGIGKGGTRKYSDLSDGERQKFDGDYHKEQAKMTLAWSNAKTQWGRNKIQADSAKEEKDYLEITKDSSKSLAPKPLTRKTLQQLSDDERQAIWDDDAAQMVKRNKEYANVKTPEQKAKLSAKWDKYERDTIDVWEDDFNSVEITPRMAKVVSKVVSKVSKQPVSDLWGPKATEKEASDFWKALAAEYDKDATRKKKRMP